MQCNPPRAAKVAIRALNRPPLPRARAPRLRRGIHISTGTPGSTAAAANQLPAAPSIKNNELADARFEILGDSSALLSASLAPSQELYTRRGTLVGLSGKADSVVSHLSTLEPFRRAVLGIPFFYQKVTSASSVTALIAPKSAVTSFAVVHMDGTVDWMVGQRKALVAWTGQSLHITPKLNWDLNLAHWGNSQVTGRGLLALAGSGQIYEVTLKEGESYVVHPSNVVAYTMNRERPLPFRFKSSAIRFEVPGVGGLARYLPETKFFNVVLESGTWKVIRNFFYTLRTWSRRNIFGDRLFLQFQGPATVLLQTRATRVRDVLTAREINEIADSPAGAVKEAVEADVKREREAEAAKTKTPLNQTRLSYAAVGNDGKVNFDKAAGGSGAGSPATPSQQ